VRALLITLVVAATACNKGPALQNAPRPDPTAVAGVAAAAATAATLADPQAAQKAEQREAAARKGGAADSRTRSQPAMPGDVLDRLDHPPAAGDAGPTDAGVDAPLDAARPRSALDQSLSGR
jgi:hypothetical protein